MQLRQSRFLRGNVTFELGERLTIRSSSLFHSNESTYDFRRISHVPNRIRHIPVLWIIAALIFAALTGAVVDDVWQGKEGSLFSFFFLTGFSGFCAWSAWTKYRNFIVFIDNITNEPAFALWQSKPSAKEVEDFVTVLTDSCKRMRVPSGATEVETVEFYIRSLQLLLDNDVLTDTEYQAALDRLNSKHAPAPVLSLVTGADRTSVK
jgi:hypothetical protein